MTFSATEAVGYAASILVVISLAMTSVVRLRTISLVGSLTFIVYGVLIASVPIAATNVAITALNVWFLRAELGGHRNLGATIVPADDPFLTDFVRYHLPDIHKFQPGFELPPAGDHVVAMLLMRDGLPAGVFVGRLDGTDLHVDLDYVTKPYRDSLISHWLYGRGASVFRRVGVERIISAPGADAHSAYLAKSGFAHRGNHYELDLP